MIKHKNTNTNSHINLNIAFTRFIRGIIARDAGRHHTGIVKSVIYVGGVLSDIIIQVLGVEGEPQISWSDSHFIIKEGDVFVINDPVMLLSTRGRYFVLKIEDDFTVKVNQGSGIIINTETSNTNSHGLGATPNPEDIYIVFTENPTNDPGNMWISGISSTQFTVNVRNDPGASHLNYEWKVDIR